MDALDGLLQPPGQIRRQSIDHVVSVIRGSGLEAEALRRLASRTDTAGCWMQAALLEAKAPAEEADTWYSRVVDAQGREIPEVLLRRARLARHRGDASRAAALLRLALQGDAGFNLFLQAETLARKLKGVLPVRRSARIALMGSSTTALLRSVIEVLCFRDGIEVTIYESPFGTYRQEIDDPESALHRFGADFVVVLLNWRDTGLPDLSGDPELAAERIAGDVAGLWSRLLRVSPCHVIQPLFDAPSSDPMLALSSVLPGGRSRLIAEINRRLQGAAPPAVTLLDTPRIAAAQPFRWEDAAEWASARQYPGHDALPVLGEEVVSVARSVLGLSSKLIALDLDNTLWGGVIGEDGLGGIVLGQPSALGERFQDLHRYLKGLQQRGILLAVVSKNNREDAEEVFRRHDASVLRMEDFAMFLANWEEKPANLSRLAAGLSLGVDSFVFLDDNPAERAAVRKALPEVIVPEISGDPMDSIAALERGRYFQAVQFTQEDGSRGALYAARARAEESRTVGGEDYLRDLDMEMCSGAVDATTAARVAQLINKTNQFNLTTRRYTQQDVEALMTSARHWFRWFRLRDRFADHGLVAVLLAERAGRERWRVDLWLMSCRTIGRGLEHYMFNQVVEAAGAEGVVCLEAEYLPTPKNGLVKDLLLTLGFSAAGGDRYELQTSDAVPLPVTARIATTAG